MSAAGYDWPLPDLSDNGSFTSYLSQIYTWLDTDKRPKKVPADTYMQMIQKWVDTKVMDTHLFPTDTNFKWLAYSSTGTSTPGSENQNPIPAGPTSLNSSLSTLSGSQWMGKESGFPKEFETEVRSIYRQINRCYAHLYWGHWLNPFWHTNLFRELNTCYIHFVNVGKVFGLLSDRDLEPMQGLIDVWTEKGLLPQTTKPQTTQQQPSGSQEQANSESQASAPAPAAVANPTSGAM
ncbi:Mob1/phocein [Patellaria atrata CBS 101060]|uniref:Mob1/phocein n=1 Tax=Patellaria atrata CBS 101060 TaxID=1346257 RepID=A0A9P4SGK3_9PEZI|nr:Mob1/phocein [Patellaria atrata CBS 101060]